MAVSLSASRSGEALPQGGVDGSYGGATQVTPNNRLTALPGKHVDDSHGGAHRGILVVTSVRRWAYSRDTVLLEKLDQLKNPVTSTRIEPAIFRLVA
jgi:hypothetical protein